MRGRALAAAIAAVALLVAPTSAGAAFDFGSNLVSPPSGSHGCGSPPCTQWNASLNNGNIEGTLTAPISGVVVRFTLSKAANPGSWSPLHLRVVEPLGAPSGPSWRGFAGSSPDLIPTHDAGLQSFPVRVPIAAGDYIGIEQDGGSAFAASMSGFGNTLDQAEPSLPADGSPGTVTTTLAGELLLQARVEPDADGDGFGDETQDGCPTSAQAQGACPQQQTTKKKKKKRCKKKKKKKGKGAAAAGKKKKKKKKCKKKRRKKRRK